MSVNDNVNKDVRPVYTFAELSLALAGESLPQWLDSVPGIERKRAEVVRFIQAGGSAYGFSTLLGHLDKYQAVEDHEPDLILAHLVGATTEVSRRHMRGITAMKLCQLSQGFNGVSAPAFAALADSFPHIGTGRNDFSASYGSGDVVPASWWLQDVIEDKSVLLGGDVIALINGQFIAAGLALAECELWERTINTSVELIERASRLVRTEDVQAPVSMRDVVWLPEESTKIVRDLQDLLVSAANEPSGNPLFYRRDEGEDAGELYAVSNSTFLSFDLAAGLWRLGDFLRVVSAYLRSATWWICQHLENRPGEILHGAYFVQPPKISKVYADRVSELAGSTLPIAQSESLFVEDIGDSALFRVQNLMEIIELIKVQCRLLDTAFVAYGAEPGRRWRFEIER